MAIDTYTCFVSWVNFTSEWFLFSVISIFSHHTHPQISSLKINERIDYELLSLTYKVLTTSQPDYLHNLISVQSTGRTRSSSVVTLARPSVSSWLQITNRSFRWFHLDCLHRSCTQDVLALAFVRFSFFFYTFFVSDYVCWIKLTTLICSVSYPVWSAEGIDCCFVSCCAKFSGCFWRWFFGAAVENTACKQFPPSNRWRLSYGWTNVNVLPWDADVVFS